MTDHAPKPAILNGQSLQAHYPQGVDWYTPFEKITLVELFKRAVEKYADLPCIDFYNKKTTFRELDELSDRAAKGFQNMGVKKGTPVGFLMPETDMQRVLFWGAVKAGATIVNYSPLYVEEELEHQIADSGTKIMITSDKPKDGKSDNYKNSVSLLKKGAFDRLVVFNLADTLPDDKSAVPAKMKKGLPLVKILNRITNFFNFTARGKISYMKGFLNNDGLYETVQTSPEDTALLQYTSGSSGVPKGTELTHTNLVSNAQQVSAYAVTNDNTPDNPYTINPGETSIFSPLPTSHIFGLTIEILVPVMQGMESIIVMDPRDLKTNADTLKRTQPDMAAFVPQLVAKMKDAGHFEDTSLKTVVTGGSAMPPVLQKEMEEEFGIGMRPGYGLTETSPVLTVNPMFGPQTYGSAGKPIPGVSIRICDVEEPNKVLNMGETGEIQAAGDNIMKGYLNRPEETAEVMTVDENGTRWFRTGDIGHVTEDGFLNITDRMKRMINLKGSGKKISPTEVENALLEHPDVAECVVVSVYKNTKNEQAKVFLKFAEGKTVSNEDLQKHLDGKVNRLAIPRMFEVLDEIPLNKTHKPDWKKLEDMEAAKVAAETVKVQPAAPSGP
ncbi:MAG: AMP-binding protein [Rhodospirillales bacterium]|nr:AMP-binding protein [Rhodospirillales bacterium]MCB9995322.1 AMP-binding protein [Rhodospirillales bacterium]